MVGWLIRWLVGRGFLDSDSFVGLGPFVATTIPIMAINPTTAHGYQALPIVVFFAYWQGSPRGLDDDDTPKNEVANDVF